MEIKIYENFLDKKDFLQIKEELFGVNFPWYFNEKVVETNIEKKDNYQFSHIFYNNFQITSSYFYLIEPILKKINPSAILRIKANFTPKFENKKEYGMHTDYENFFGKTAVYYVNNNNGQTVFNNNNKIDSLENSIAIFKGNMQHSATTSTDDKRIVINFNFYEWEEIND